MKFAIVDHKKVEATKGVKGICPSCGSDVIARCGEIKVHHWAHKGIRNCDSWWENETEWHRSWKQYFPDEWQEVVHTAKDGEKHIADVKTDSGWVLEFQHSYLNPEERRSRDVFYPQLVWVVDGMRRKRDIIKFKEAIILATRINPSLFIYKVDFPVEYKIIDEWFTSPNLVFFDFQANEDDSDTFESVVFGKYLWFLIPDKSESFAYLSYVPRESFIQMHKEGTFEEVFYKQIEQFREHLAKPFNHSRRVQVRIKPRSFLSNRELRRRNRRF